MVEPRRDLKQKRFPSIFKCCRSKKNNLTDNPYPTVRTMDFETLDMENIKSRSERNISIQKRILAFRRLHSERSVEVMPKCY